MEFRAGDNSPNPMQLPNWNKLVAGSLAKFPIYVQQDKGRSSFHRQPGIEIHITQQGRGSFLMGDQSLPQEPGRVLVLHGTVPHQMVVDAEQPFVRTVVCIETNKLESLTNHTASPIHNPWGRLETNYNLSVSPAVFHDVDALCYHMVREIRDKEAGWQRMMVAQLLELTVLLERSHLERLDPDNQGMTTLAKLCRGYVHQNLDKDLSLKQVANTFCVSPEHLTRTFRKDLKVSFYHYVLEQRIKEAKRLLRDEPVTPVTEVAFSLGFASSAHFSRTFRKVTGETPTAFRRRITRPRAHECSNDR